MRFNWTPEYSVKVAMFDEQHQHFFEIANRIEEAVEQENTSRENLISLITELGGYAMYHLAEEEKYFTQYNYPAGEAHTQVHNLFRDKVKVFMEDVSKDASDAKEIAKEMAEFAGLWLFQHINTMDKSYSDFFAQHGL